LRGAATNMTQASFITATGATRSSAPGLLLP
jgi:hypothetical protein